MADATRHELPPHVKAEVQRILDREARRILDELNEMLGSLKVTRWRNGKQVG